MQERIDTLIKMRKEKPEHKDQWDLLKGRLLRLIPEEKTHELRKAFELIELDEAVSDYDQLFHEVLITGKFTDKRTIAMVNNTYLAPATASSIASNAARQTLTDEMVKLYAQHKEKQDKKKTK